MWKKCPSKCMLYNKNLAFVTRFTTCTQAFVARGWTYRAETSQESKPKTEGLINDSERVFNQIPPLIDIIDLLVAAASPVVATRQL